MVRTTQGCHPTHRRLPRTAAKEFRVTARNPTLEPMKYVSIRSYPASLFISAASYDPYCKISHIMSNLYLEALGPLMITALLFRGIFSGLND